jgi:hypothetical protein
MRLDRPAVAEAAKILSTDDQAMSRMAGCLIDQLSSKTDAISISTLDRARQLLVDLMSAAAGLESSE